MRKLVGLVALFALAGCNASQAGGSATDVSGSDAFLELVNDARLAVREGKLPEAGRLYDQAREIEPQNPGLWVDIARLRFRGGEHLTAIEAADYALELDPQFGPALLLEAQLVRDAHGLAAALPWFESAAAADPRNPEVLADYAATLGDLGRYNEMLAMVRKLAEFAPDYPKVHYLQAVLAARAEDPVLAGSLLNRSGLNDQGVPAAIMLDAIVNLQQGNYDTAADSLEKLMLQQPNNVRVKELLARAFWLGGRDRELVNRFAGVASQANASSYLMMLVGRSYERMGQRNRAISFIERANAERSAEPFVLDGSGAIPDATNELRQLLRSRNVSGANRVANTLLKRAPYSGDFHALAGDVALATGDEKRALEMYEIASRVRRSWPLTRKVIRAFRAYDDPVAAEVLLVRYLAGDPQNIEALFLLAKVSAEKEDWLRVIVLLDTAIGLGAGNDLEVLALRADAARVLGREDEAARFDKMRSERKPAAFLAEG